MEQFRWAIVSVSLLAACARTPDHKPPGGGGRGGTASGGASGAAGGISGGRGGSTGGTSGASGTGASGHGGGGAAGGGGSGAAGTGGGGAAGAGGAIGPGSGVLQHHNHASRDGVYVDPALTKTALASLHLDPTFASPTLAGPTTAQALYLDGVGGKPDLVFAATLQNHVYALDAATGGVVWERMLGPTSMPQANGCKVGVTGIRGTPIIDGGRRIIYLDAVINVSLDGGNANKHMVFALDADTGATRPGWPVDVDATARSGAVAFDSTVQRQQGGLALLGGMLYLPYGGIGDCGDYHGWVVGIATDDPTRVIAWATRGRGGGIWAPSGISSDGTSLYVSTGNTLGTGDWRDGEAVFKLPPSLTPTYQPSDYYVPTDWTTLDTYDLDLGGTGPLVIDLPGATPSALIVALGKDQFAHVLDRNNLGAFAGPLIYRQLITGPIITAAAAYPTSQGLFIAIRGYGACSDAARVVEGNLTVFTLTARAPPTIALVWCGGPATVTAPAVTMSDAQGTDSVIWMVSDDNKLHGYDGETGQPVFDGGTDTVTGVQPYHTPIAAHGRIFVVGDEVYAFTPR